MNVMNKKLSLLLFISVVLCIAANAQTFTVFQHETGNVVPRGVSADGKYIVGEVANSNAAFTWTKEDGFRELTGDGGICAYAVSNTGRAVGCNGNPDYPLTYGSVNTAAYFQYGESAWNFLPVTFQVAPKLGDGNRALGVSPDGTIVVGAQPYGSDIVQLFAGYWDISDAQNPKYVSLVETATHNLSEGSNALCVSGDGKIIGGWCVFATDFPLHKIPVLWKEGTMTQIEGAATEYGQVNSISSNGKYAALTCDTKAKYYDIENNKIISFHEGSLPSVGNAVSDNGLLVGGLGSKPFMGTDTRDAFVYSEATGMLTLREYLTEAGVEIPEGFKFYAATSISADGNIIVGHGDLNSTPVGFHIELTEVVDDTPFIIIQSSSSVIANGISSDGKYIVGEVGNKHHMFTWSKAKGIDEWDAVNTNIDNQGSTAMAVSPSGRVVGSHANPEHASLVELWNSETNQYEFIPLPAQTAAFNDFGEKTWTLLPVKIYLLPLKYNSGTTAYAVSDDGNIIVGAEKSGGDGGRPIATYWDVSDPENVVSVALLEDGGNGSGRGHAIQAVSGDGKVMGGFYSPDWESAPVLWIDGVLTELVGVNGKGAVYGISNNGNYAALTSDTKAGVYRIKEKKFTFLEEGTGKSTALAVSNNGVVVGYTGESTYFGGDTRKAFIYTASKGIMHLDELFTELAIEYPAGFYFRAATGISADGRKITGWGVTGGKTVSFYAEIPEFSVELLPVESVSIVNNVYGKNELTWEAPEEGSSLSLTGYNIYCNDKMIHTTTETSYAHTGLTDGTYIYTVSAVYDNEKEARTSKAVRVTMGRKSVPYFEGFNDCQHQWVGQEEIPLSTVFWDVTANTLPFEESWHVGASGQPVPCAFFFMPGAGAFEESLTSPFLDARGTKDLILRFNMTPPGVSSVEKMKVEISDGTKWHQLDEMTGWGSPFEGFLAKEYDASVAAGKENVRIRFTCHGAYGSGLNWNIDNIELADKAHAFVPEPPSIVAAVEDKDAGHIMISWADPNGVAKLRYVYKDEQTAGMIGNEGKTFIAANMYTPEDLAIYKDFKITALSFMPATNPGAAISKNATYKWYVAQDGKRLYDAPVKDSPTLQWVTEEVSAPIEIDVTKPLYYGVEIVTHEPLDLPIATSDLYYLEPYDIMYMRVSIDVYAGKGNIYSEDGGQTWEQIPTYIDEYNNPVYQLFCVAATIAKDPAVSKKEGLWTYSVYRNGKNIMAEQHKDDQFKETRLTNFIDANPLPAGTEACYEVRASYFNLLVSEPVQACYTRVPYHITASATGEGTISPSGEVAVEHGKDQTFTFTPADGYKLEKILVDGNEVAEEHVTDKSYTFTKVTEDHTIAGVFEREVSISEAESFRVMAYPNPIAHGETLNVEVNAADDMQNTTLKLYSISGAMIKEVKITGKVTPVQLDVAPGLYVLKVEDRVLRIVVK